MCIHKHICIHVAICHAGHPIRTGVTLNCYAAIVLFVGLQLLGGLGKEGPAAMPLKCKEHKGAEVVDMRLMATHNVH